MTSKLVVNTIEADTGISSVSFGSSISLSSTSKFFFGAAGIDIGADTNINRPAAGVLGFNINSAEKFRIDSSGHIKAVGVCTATHFYGDGSNLTGISGVSVANQADNRLITATGTTDALNAESSLTYDGTKVLNITSSAGGFFQGTDSDGGIGLLEMGNGDVAIQADTGNSINNSKIHFFLDGSEKLRIDSSGRVLIGTTIQGTAGADELTLSTGGSTGITIRSGSSNDGNLYFAMGTTGNETYRGFIQYEHSNNALRFGTNATERLRMTSAGRFGFNRSAPQYAMHLSPADGQSRIDLHMTNDTTGHNNNDGVQFGYQNSAGAYIWNFENTNIYFGTNNATRLRITSNGDLLLGGHSAYTYDDTGASNVILDIYGGATAGRRGILSLSGRSGSNNADLGTIWFNNDNNSGASPGNNMKLAAAIQAKSVTSDNNAQNDSGAYLQFFTKAESGSVTERMRISSGGNVNIGGEYTQTTYPFQLTGSGGGDAAAMAIKNLGVHPAKLHLMSGHGNWSVSNSTTVGDAFEVRDEGANSTRMMINSSGHVTKPDTPCFIVRHTNAETYSANSYIDGPWTVTLNRGSHFNTSNGIFTAPVAGLYQVNMMMNNDYNSSTTSGNFKIYVNNSLYAGMQFDPLDSHNRWFTHTLTGTLNLSVNDTVRLYSGTSCRVDNYNWNHWSMYLVG